MIKKNKLTKMYLSSTCYVPSIMQGAVFLGVSVSSILALGCSLKGSTCPDWEWNRPPFGSQVGAQSTEPQQPGLEHDS